ncbi:Coiled-coil domain-containing protein 103 [Pleodorina starrii]|uniref:Coiled-coil domain-containing protein 103 n=1 Tax=Pleodorina starrii TaxID=330485 RepID=A0A9W6BWN4_9CHLO|nr:Coiled-coil domain-containing protein 103 [Pleodorina starrii]
MHDSTAPGHRPAKTSKELATAAYDDFKRKAIDEAKKRAVSQRVDYDTFKNMVLTAHLAPITAPNRRANDRPAPCWNFGTDGRLVKRQDGTAELPSLAPVGVPRASGDFSRYVVRIAIPAALEQQTLSPKAPPNPPCLMRLLCSRDWRRIGTADDKYRYLQLCGPDVLRAIFRVEISSEVLREILAVLEACWLGHGGAAEEAEGGAGAALREAAFVTGLLEALSGAGRFSLAIKLLGSSTKPVLERLFTGLEDAATASAAYGAEATPAAEVSGATSALDLTLGQVTTLRQLYGV